MNDLIEEKAKQYKRRISLLCSIFLMGMLFVGAYISKLPHVLAFVAVMILILCFILIVYNSIKLRKINQQL